MAGKWWIVVGALAAGLGVAAGAFGAHGLKKVLSPEQLQTFETAVRYQMYHAMAIILCGLLMGPYGSKLIPAAGVAFLVGILIFSGGLYAWVLSEIRAFALIVPLGGLSWIAGWILLAIAAARSR